MKVETLGLTIRGQWCTVDTAKTSGDRMPRDDMTKYLVHWTKGADYGEAFETLCQIVLEQKLRGSGELIRGGWRCICFTEAPEVSFHQIAGKYKPFGIQIPKTWLFDQGGRPVIYETQNEYDLLPDEIKWRHMRYEPNAHPPFDFSWEREWRIQTAELFLDPVHTRIILPHESWAEQLVREHENMQVQLLASQYGEEWQMYPVEEVAFSYAVIHVEQPN